MSDSLESEIAELPKMSRDQLRAKWRLALGQSAPSHLRKPLLVPLLAYKLQEQAYGGLKPEVKRQLSELARRFDKHSQSNVTNTPTLRQIKPGTRLIREWQGVTHHVTVREKGFEHKGRRYKSLSEIARLITGTRWSGPLFFGLKQKNERKIHQ